MVVRELTDEVGEDFDVPVTKTFAELRASGAVPVKGFKDYYSLEGEVYAPVDSGPRDSVSSDSELFYRRNSA